MTLSTLLIANRGEIAIRIARTARRMGIRTVAVFSDADRDAPHVSACDLAIALGGTAPAESYLRVEKLIDAAKKSGADAVHPGYGFLSEKADFARACAASDLVFVGPSPASMEAMGDKAAARRLMRAAGVPVLEGYDGEDQTDATLAAEAARIGFPVMIKAAAGGGGRGIRLVEEPAAFGDARRAARAEAQAAFGDGRLLLERTALCPRHVEVQVFGDTHGAIVHLGERDCSVQRRHQKLIEEAPAPGLTGELRAAMGEAAVKAARAVDYIGAGTVEFLLDAAGRFTFMEMNTRLQVEHPVTEAVTGLDLVEWQIRVARGEKLPLAQEQIRMSGHAIEARLVAEDSADFLPQTGTVRTLALPAGIRIDHALAEGLAISPHYDSLLGKIIAHGGTREEARASLLRALGELVVLGVATNRGFLLRGLADDDFAAGKATTAFIAERFPDAASRAPEADANVQALAFALLGSGIGGAWQSHDLPLGWTNAAAIERPMRVGIDGAIVTGRARHGARPDAPRGVFTLHIMFGGTTRRVELPRCLASGAKANAQIDGVPLPFRFVSSPAGSEGWLHLAGADHHLRDLSLATGKAGAAGGLTSTGQITAPMHGKLASVRVAVGEIVAPETIVATLEAMKLEHALRAGIAGEVAAIHAAVGTALRPGAAIMTIGPNAETPN